MKCSRPQLTASTIGAFCSAIALGFPWAAMASTTAAKSVTRPAVLESKRVNRSVLTVGREIFSAADAVALLALWNLTRPASENAVEIDTKWLAGFTLQDLVQPDIQLMNSIWPEDVKVFFRIALVWVDVQKLNLFIPSEQEIKPLLASFVAKRESLLAGVEPALAAEIAGASEKTKRKWIEMVVRARTFFRVRGSFERNRNLFNVGWYWHSATGAGSSMQ
jgi:hypothetical protein